MNEFKNEKYKEEEFDLADTLARVLIAVVICAIVMAIAIKAVKAEEYLHLQWFNHKGKSYWFENNEIQGTYGDPKNIWDKTYGIERGREIYDPASDAWYWLDTCYYGAKAENKEVWMPYVFQDEKPGLTDGKWVRYDSEGHMIKGWYTNEKGTYYYDPVTGGMAKGLVVVDGKYHYFDKITGVFVR